MEDVLNRQPFIDDIKTIIKHYSEKKKNITFAINGKWGTGKTFLLEMLEDQLKNEYIVFHYNAWEYDYYEEPLIALITSTIEQLGDFIKAKKTTEQVIKTGLKTAKKALTKVLGEFCRNKLGVDIVKIAQEWHDDVKTQKKEDKAYDKNLNITEKVKEIQKALSELSEIRTIVFVVDETDRCLPEYAIKVLERLHHVFSGVENLQVVLSVDKDQLNNTIETIFGKETDKNSYLRKFLSFTIELPIGELEKNIVAESQPAYYSQFTTLKTTKEEDVNEFITRLLCSYDMRTKLEVLEKAACLHNMLYKKESPCDMTYLCAELLMIVCQREGILNKRKLGEVAGKTPLKVFLTQDGFFAFFGEKINEAEEDPRWKKRYCATTINGGYVIQIKEIDIWAVLWTTICYLYGGSVAANIKPEFNVMHHSVAFMKELSQYEEQYLEMCEIIE